MTSYTNEVFRLLRLFYPILISQVAQTAMGLIDTVMAGQVSARDLAAISVASSFWLPVMLVVYGTLIALTPIIAHLSGARKEDQINFELQQGVWVAIPACILAMLTLYYSPFLIGFMNIDQVLLEKTIGYLHAILWGLPGLAGFILLRNLIEGRSKTKPTMIISILGLLANIPLNYLFIYGFGPIPQMGSVGCGVATAIVLWIMFSIGLIYVYFEKSYHTLNLGKTLYGPQWSAIQRILSLGLPIALAIFFEVTLFSVVGVLITPLGPTVVAGHQVAFNISNMIFTLPMSIGLALTIRVGHSLGEEKFYQAKIATQTGLMIGVIVATVCASITYFSRESIADLYSNDKAVISIAAHLLLFSCMYQIFDAIQVIAAHALRGYKDTRVILTITFTSYWCVGLPIGIILGLTDLIMPAMGAQGFWIGFICGLLCAAFLFLLRLRFIFHKHEPMPQPTYQTT